MKLRRDEAIVGGCRSYGRQNLCQLEPFVHMEIGFVRLSVAVSVVRRRVAWCSLENSSLLFIRYHYNQILGINTLEGFIDSKAGGVQFRSYNVEQLSFFYCDSLVSIYLRARKEENNF